MPPSQGIILWLELTIGASFFKNLYCLVFNDRINSAKFKKYQLLHPSFSNYDETVITIILGIVKIHTYPGKIAKARNHPQTQAIEVTSLLGLIVFPLWMLALVWAYSGAVIGVMYTKADDEPPTAPSKDTDKRSVDSDEKDADQVENHTA